MTRLETRFDGAYQASAGAIYPTLQQLEDEGLARVEASDERKVYHATDAGRVELRARQADVEQIWARAAIRGEWGLLADPSAAEIVGPALRLMKAAVKTIIHAHHDPALVEQVRNVLDEARQHIERLDRRRKRR